MRSNSVRDRLHGVVAQVRQRFAVNDYAAVLARFAVNGYAAVQACSSAPPRFAVNGYATVPARSSAPPRSPAGQFGSATLFGARALRFASADGQRTAAEHEAALVKARRTAYVARLWTDPAVVWAV